MRLTKTLIVLILFLTAFSYTVTHYWLKEKKAKEALKTILHSKETIYKNDSLQNVSKVILFSASITDLKNAVSKEVSKRSDYEKRLAEAYKNIELSEAKIKNTKAYYESLLSSRDTFYQPLPNDCQLKPIKSKHIDIDFIYQDSTVGISYDYRTKQNIVITLFPKLKENGKKHWPNWGNLPWVGWDNTSVWTVEDKKANISNQISIEFKK